MLLRLLTILVTVTSTSFLHSQNKVNGTYAGSWFVNSVSGMQRYDLAYNFRSNGTYCSNFSKTDWQTRVDGTYTIQGDKVVTVNNDGKTTTLTILSDGDLLRSPYRLFKLNTPNSIPRIALKHINASSMGGVEGMVYTQESARNYIAFDGKNNFAHSAFKAFLAAGEELPVGVNGGTNEFKGHGFYTIKNGVLTLKYKDGTTAVKSFFFKGGNTPMALIDGRIFYELKEANNTASNHQTTVKKEKTGIKNNATLKTLSGAELLKKANLAHGGKNLDNIQTLHMQFKAKGGDVNAVLFIDVSNQKIRYELYRSGKMFSIEQVAGNEGWKWADGKITDISLVRIKEIRNILATGVLGLRSSSLQNIKIKSTEYEQNNDGHILKMDIGGKEYVWVFDNQYRLTGEITATAGERKSEISSNFRNAGGILWPFATDITNNSNKYAIEFSTITVNPLLAEATWKKPK